MMCPTRKGPLARSWWRHTAVLGAAATLVLAGCAGGGDDGGPSGGGGSGPVDGVDDGTSLTMWTRAATQIQSEAFVESYNESHENQIELTVIPTDDYQTRIGAAAGAGSLPDLFASDVVFLPNYTSNDLLLDVTDRIDALPFVEDIAPSHLDAGTWDGKKYAVPHTMDLSVLFYNKDIYEKAGLDPEVPPTTLEEFGEHARAISAANIPGVSGTFFGGNCAGCMAFTWWPSIWASGGEVLNEDGTAAELDSPEAAAVFDLYRGLVEDDVVLAGTRDETGATWVSPFPDGKVGLMPMPSTMLGSMPDSTGVAPIPGLDGGESTFVGGDAIGIASSSENPDQAWNFLAWSLGDEAQIDVLAENNDVVARSDLAVNEYSEQDERVITINEVVAEGRTPYALDFGAAFNDPNGPFLVLLRNQIFGEATTLSEDNAAITAALAG